MSDLRLVVFDVDGTLIDSQGHILAAMQAAFADQGLDCPARETVLSIVGLSLEQAFAHLVPGASSTTRTALSDAYKHAFADLRKQGRVASPLYPGIQELLDRLTRRDDVLLGVATGKSRRGLASVLETHGLERHFVTLQCADDHPSKPHPSMVQAALSETGLEPGQAVMVGDTSFDIEMGRAAGLATVAVTWGYHPATALQQATHVVERPEALEPTILTCLERAP